MPLNAVVTLLDELCKKLKKLMTAQKGLDNQCTIGAQL